MKLTTRIGVLVGAALILCLNLLGQEGTLDASQPKNVTPEQVIQRFAAKEKEFKEAREQYTYRQSVTMQTLDGDTVTGEYKEVFDVTYDDKGRHLENVVFAPQSSLEEISMTPEDLDDIRHRHPFVLTSDETGEYDILYVGQQQEDELHCYVFDMAPKKIEGKKRYFQGRIWVDDHDFQIVKTFGTTVPQIHKKNNENLFPKFTTWRTQVDDKYWFPAFTKADDTLHFRLNDVHIREVIKYEDYRKFGANTRITYQGKEIPKASPNQKDKQPDNEPEQPQK